MCPPLVSVLEEDGTDSGVWRRPGFSLQIERFEAVEQAVLQGEKRGRGAGGRAGLGVDALDVGLGRLGGDGESVPDPTWRNMKPSMGSPARSTWKLSRR
ncbi:MAG TPA: hypothetical protein VFI46_07325 [Jiangellaceae bacterium]|nr:hypothetical protein [Jiangellaceae bacterium]